MKIVYFTDTYRPQINGVVTSIDLFIEELRKDGHEVHIFCPKDKKLKEDKYIHSIRSFKFRPYPEYRVGIPTFGVFSLIKKINPDIIHIQTPASIGLVGLVIAKRLKIPVVMTYHTLLSDYFRYLPGATVTEKNAKKIINKYTKWFFNKANLVIAPSEETKKMLEKIGVKSLEVLPTGIKTGKISFKKIKHRRPYMLHVGRLCREKSIDIVIKAFKKLQKKIDCDLIITSSGPAGCELKNLVKKLGLEERVKFTGYVGEDEKYNLYYNASLFVTASVTDTQGVVLLESMFSKTPVIAPDTGGMKNFIEDGKNGLIFKSGNVDDLAEKMHRILKDAELRRKLVKNGFKTVKKLTIENAAKKLEEIYKDAIESKRVSVIIPTFMEEKCIEKCLKSIKSQSYKNYEIIVVDSSSSDKTINIAKKYADRLIVIKERGVSKARNAGANAAKGDVFLFLDADVALQKDFLRNFVKEFRKSVVGVCGSAGSYGSPCNKFVYWACSKIAWLSTIFGVPLFYGMCMGLRADVFKKLKGFNEDFSTAEDYDLSLRARKEGRCVIAKNASFLTSPRRLKERGFRVVLFHVKNFLSYAFSKKSSKNYPVIR